MDTALPRDWFNAWVPGCVDVFSKSTSATVVSPDPEGSPSRGYIAGVVSTDAVDFQGDAVDQGGLIWDYFLKYGWFDCEHDGQILGHPTKVTPGDQETHIEGYLLLEVPRAKDFFEKALALKAAGSSRKLGYSVQGKILERDPVNKSRIKKAVVMRVALSEHPVNASTYLDPVAIEKMEKSLISAGYQTPAVTTGAANGPYSSIYKESLSAPITHDVARYKEILKVFRAMEFPVRTWKRAEQLHQQANGNLNVALSLAKSARPLRADMPQLDVAGVVRVVAGLRKAGMLVRTETVPPESLKLTQRAVSGPKVVSMADALSRGVLPERRIIVSSDDMILDGHHYVAAMKKLGRAVAVYRVPMTMEQLLQDPIVWEQAESC